MNFLKKTKSVVFILMLMLAFQSLHALDSNFKADSLNGSLGHIFRFSWSIKHAPEANIRTSDIVLDGSGIEIVDRKLIEDQNGTEIQFQAAIYDSVGIYHFPSFVVYEESKGGIDSLFIQGPDLEINSVLSASDTTFRDIKGLHHIRMPINLTILLWIMVLGLLLYLAYFLIKRYKRSEKDQKPVRIIIPPEQAHIIALRDLEKLKRAKYLRLEQFKTFYSELTHILKQYYENRYLIDALELTSSELMEKMESMHECETMIATDTQKILEKADLVKFAKETSTELDSGKALTQAIDIVNKTRIHIEKGDNK